MKPFLSSLVVPVPMVILVMASNANPSVPPVTEPKKFALFRSNVNANAMFLVKMVANAREMVNVNAKMVSKDRLVKS